MKIGLCQVDVAVGAFEANRRRIELQAHQARRQGAQLAVFPELALCGYPPEDLLLRPAFLAAHDAALQELAANMPPDLAVLVGCLERNPGPDGNPLYNAVALLEDGVARIVARKCLLPTYDVFDEARWFEPGTTPERNLVTIAGTRVGVVVCEDGWNDATFFAARRYPTDPVQSVVDAGAEVVVNLSASPWEAGKDVVRCRMVQAAALRHGVPFVYVNLVGGNVGLQFDGGSIATRGAGFAFAPQFFTETLQVVDTQRNWDVALELPPVTELRHRALVQGIRAYCTKFGFRTALIGLSGGIDSALTAALAADALGPENVTGVALPSRISSDHSLEDAAELARRLGIAFATLPIQGIVDAADAALAPSFVGTKPGVAEENLQARARGMVLMGLANKHGHLLLATGNKSEIAVGYCTLYGDMCGGLTVLGDLWKTEVWELARWINRDDERIPRRSIEKPPSAELREGQYDTDSLPPYDVLDPVLRELIEANRSTHEVAASTGVAVSVVADLFRRVQSAEYKRAQAAPTLRLTTRGFAGWRMPASHRYLQDGSDRP